MHAQALKMSGIKDIFRLKLYEDGYVQAGFDTRTFNEMVVIVGNTTWEVMNARKKVKLSMGTNHRNQRNRLSGFRR